MEAIKVNHKVAVGQGPQRVCCSGGSGSRGSRGSRSRITTVGKEFQDKSTQFHSKMFQHIGILDIDRTVVCQGKIPHFTQDRKQKGLKVTRVAGQLGRHESWIGTIVEKTPLVEVETSGFG